MFDVSLALRRAYIEKLKDIEIGGVKIPFYDEFLGASPAKINYAIAYALITDQTSSDILLKCGFYNDVSITIDIVTKYPVNKGGKELSELISNEILKLLRTGNTADYPEMEDFKIITCVKTLARGVIEENLDSTVFRKILIFNHKIQQIN